MAQAAPSVSPSKGNGGSLGVTLNVGPTTTPSEAIAQLEGFAAAFESHSSREDWLTPNPKRFAAYRAYIRLGLASVEWIDAATAAGFYSLSESESERLEAIRDRLDELVDTLSWSADAPDELAQLAEAACG